MVNMLNNNDFLNDRDYKDNLNDKYIFISLISLIIKKNTLAL